jgi:hypothetical protein
MYISSLGQKATRRRKSLLFYFFYKKYIWVLKIKYNKYK